MRKASSLLTRYLHEDEVQGMTVVENPNGVLDSERRTANANNSNGSLSPFSHRNDPMSVQILSCEENHH